MIYILSTHHLHLHNHRLVLLRLHMFASLPRKNVLFMHVADRLSQHTISLRKLLNIAARKQRTHTKTKRMVVSRYIVL